MPLGNAMKQWPFGAFLFLSLPWRLNWRERNTSRLIMWGAHIVLIRVLSQCRKSRHLDRRLTFIFVSHHWLDTTAQSGIWKQACCVTPPGLTMYLKVSLLWPVGKLYHRLVPSVEKKNKLCSEINKFKCWDCLTSRCFDSQHWLKTLITAIIR